MAGFARAHTSGSAGNSGRASYAWRALSSSRTLSCNTDMSQSLPSLASSSVRWMPASATRIVPICAMLGIALSVTSWVSLATRSSRESENTLAPRKDTAASAKVRATMIARRRKCCAPPCRDRRRRSRIGRVVLHRFPPVQTAHAIRYRPVLGSGKMCRTDLPRRRCGSSGSAPPLKQSALASRGDEPRDREREAGQEPSTQDCSEQHRVMIDKSNQLARRAR